MPVSKQVVEQSWSIRPAGPEDAEAWLDVHHDSMASAYPAMPPGFLDLRRASRPSLLTDLRSTLAEPGGRRHLVAVDRTGAVVGIGQTHPGAQPWERRMLTEGYAGLTAGTGLGRGLAEPPLLQLTTLYTLTGWHGSGLGPALAGQLVGEEPCYLWIMVGNQRAEAFYRRIGFVRGSVAVPSGASWYGWPMFQMVRE